MSDAHSNNHGHNGHDMDMMDIERLLLGLVAAGIEARTKAVEALGTRLATETDPAAIPAILKAMAELTIPIDVLELSKTAAGLVLDISHTKAKIVEVLRQLNEHHHPEHGGHGHHDSPHLQSDHSHGHQRYGSDHYDNPHRDSHRRGRNNRHG